MNAVTPVILTTPDGVDRPLRFTLGASKRIYDRFAMDFQSALKVYDSAALPEILFALMHDAKGQPPDITAAELAEILPADGTPEILGAIMSAATQGKVPKNELELMFRREMEKKLLIGSPTTVSVLNSSDSLTNSSGGDSSSAKLPPAPSDTESVSEHGTVDSVS